MGEYVFAGTEQGYWSPGNQFICQRGRPFGMTATLMVDEIAIGRSLMLPSFARRARISGAVHGEDDPP